MTAKSCLRISCLRTSCLRILADANIANVADYFTPEQMSARAVRLHCVAGRDITAQMLAQYRPDVLLLRSVTEVNAHLLADNDSVHFVGSATIGTDHIDQDYLTQRGIVFANAAGCSKHSVAQYVLTAILSLRPSYWQQSIRLGIIGLGNIGSSLAAYAQDLGWQVLGYDPLLPVSSINNTRLDEVLSSSDVISLHVPLTTAMQSQHPTYHLINASRLAQMPAHTLLINTARGAVVSEADLLADMQQTQRQVVLDVFEHEPIVSGSLLDRLAVATPHIAGYTLEGKLRGTQMIYQALCDYLAISAQQRLDNLLPDNPYTWSALLKQPQRLLAYYDIAGDDAVLRHALDASLGQVPGDAFDALRKSYRLRREWIDDGMTC